MKINKGIVTLNVLVLIDTSFSISRNVQNVFYVQVGAMKGFLPVFGQYFSYLLERRYSVGMMSAVGMRD